MRKAFILLAAAGLLASCDKESYRHAISMSNPYPGTYGAMYADQPKDTIVFTTFDSYRATTTDTWITIDPGLAEMEIENSYYGYYQIGIPVTFEPNTTGETRVGEISIYNYGPNDWSATATASYLQLGWLNVTRPQPSYEYNSSLGYPQMATFELTDTAMQVTDTLTFVVYGDWELSLPEEQESEVFVTLLSASGQAGSVKAPIALEENATKEERRNTINLTSRGVTTPLVIKQEAQEE
ncbi:MAG: hypothetical protein LUC86_09375 [Prevotellaceae bacterium]|nr:hypothetical protein [Prevotellaceae bacterium]